LITVHTHSRCRISPHSTGSISPRLRCQLNSSHHFNLPARPSLPQFDRANDSNNLTPPLPELYSGEACGASVMERGCMSSSVGNLQEEVLEKARRWKWRHEHLKKYVEIKETQMEDQDGEMTDGVRRRRVFPRPSAVAKATEKLGCRACGGRKTEIPQAAKGTPTEVLIYVSGMITTSSFFLRRKKSQVEMDRLTATPHNSPAFISVLDPPKHNLPKGSPHLPNLGTIEFEYGVQGACIYDFSPLIRQTPSPF